MGYVTPAPIVASHAEGGPVMQGYSGMSGQIPRNASHRNAQSPPHPASVFVTMM